MSIRWVLMLGAVLCAVSVIGGAFGAHSLEARLTADRLALWKTAAQYLMVGGLGAIGAGLMGNALNLERGTGGAALIIGGLIFGGTVAILALGGPRWLGAITPIGGLLLIVGFLQMAWVSWRSF